MSGAAENPGLSDVLDLVTDKGLLGELLGDGLEALSMMRSRKIAKAHVQIWEAIFAKLALGEKGPFGEAPADGPRTASIGSTFSAESSSALRPNPRRDLILDFIREHPGMCTVRHLSEVTGTDASAACPPTKLNLRGKDLSGEAAGPATANTSYTPKFSSALRPNPRRDLILKLVREHPGVTVSQLGVLMGTAPSALYAPVRVLREHGMIRRDGHALYAASNLEPLTDNRG